MKKADIKLGAKVKTLTEWPLVPIGTLGVIVWDYGSGIQVAWDLPDQPYPYNKEPEEVAGMFAIDPTCPLRDGFAHDELKYLELLND